MKVRKNWSLRPKRRLSGATRFAPTSAAAMSRNGVNTNALKNRGMFSAANAEPTKCNEASLYVRDLPIIRHGLLK
jgi:hypothetical protein